MEKYATSISTPKDSFESSINEKDALLELNPLLLEQTMKPKRPSWVTVEDEKPDQNGQLAIHRAALAGDSKTIKDMNSSLHVETTTNLGWRPIHLAAMGGHIDVAKALKELGAKLDGPSKTWKTNTNITHFPLTALQLAVIKGHEEFAFFLLDNGADYEVAGPAGQNMLHYAGHSGLLRLFAWLVGQGMDPFIEDKQKLTPFHWAACENRVEICKEYLKLAKKHGKSLNLEQSVGETPLGCALRRGHPETAKLLIEAGADVHHRNGIGHSPLMFAPFVKDHTVFRSIVEKGVDINVRDHQDQITALHVAAAKKDLAGCKLLVARGADIDAQTKDGWSPLIVAVDYHATEVVEFLLSAGADPSLKGEFGMMIFEYAQNYAPVEKLLTPLRAKHCHPQTTSEMNDKIFTHLQNTVISLPENILEATAVQRVERSSLLWTVANGLFLLKDFAGTKMCLEMAVFNDKWFERDMEYDCRMCGKDSAYNSFWACKQCPILRGVCGACYEKKADGDVMPGCHKEHEYFEVGGQEWSRSGAGAGR
ncbi:hypothetical protein G7Y89_g14292 [Cudoniella acicularis]|uniref:Uncharacterized protein n=1 Tax=Cudoniella acicularis TaxID=354080 RepID=A0A8H4R4G4_9HELO|nr:hypothetical protein G7Y89_g14292 [Cudoniella acicularis]